MNRRDFLRLTGAAVAATAVGLPDPDPLAERDAMWLEGRPFVGCADDDYIYAGNPVTTASLDELMKQVYGEPLSRSWLIESEMMSLFDDAPKRLIPERAKHVTLSHYVSLA